MNMLLVASWDEAVQIRGNDADDNPMLIGTLNGVVDLETGEIIQNSKEYFITKRVNASFDKEAKCPIWDKFLNRITGEDQDMIEYLNLLTSYLLTGKTNEHKLFIIHGPGANGKTTWVKCIQDIMDEYASQIPVESLSYTGSNAIDDNLARTKGSRLTVTSEIKKGTRLNEPLIKQLTGGDKVTARQMFKGSTEYKSTSKFMIVANHLPEITGSDSAMARRIQVIPFNQVIRRDEEDKFLSDKLKGEYNAIFTRAILMCPEWRQYGLTLPKSVVEASADYVESKDIFKCWKNDEVDPSASNKDFVSHDELIMSHKAWCNDHSLNALDVNTFSARLQSCTGITKCRKRINSKQERGYTGVKLAV
jgi:putative DNA primase/helicase